MTQHLAYSKFSKLFIEKLKKAKYNGSRMWWKNSTIQGQEEVPRAWGREEDLHEI